MANPKNRLPDCGLYRATKALPANEEKIPAGSIVYFHNHSDQGSLPSVLAPDHNVHNRWHFHGPPIVFRGLTWVETLEALPAEGFYILRKELNEDGALLPKSTIVQLGYTQKADPILFVARIPAQLTQNVLLFSEKGIGIKREFLSHLEQTRWHTEAPEPGGHTSGQHE